MQQLLELQNKTRKRSLDMVAQLAKNLPTVQETRGSIQGLGRSPGEGNGNPVQSSCLETPMDNGAYSLRGHKSRTRLSD